MKPKTVNPELNRQILEEASDWFVDFRVGDVDAAARERFDEWLRRSPEHIRAYWEIAKTYVDLSSLKEAGMLDVDALIARAHSDGNVVPINAGAPPDEPSAKPGVAPRSGRSIRAPARRRRFAAAAGCALAAIIGTALWWQSERYPSYTTDAGERRSLTLADGSTVDLNVRSSIRVEFSNSERRIELLDGQALFQVAKDKERAFIVRSGDATVRAVGTQFDVYRKSSGITITVLEGRVAVYRDVHRARDSDGESLVPSAEDAPPRHSKPASLPSNSARHDAAEPRTLGTTGAAPAVPATALPAPPAGLTDPSGGAAVFLSAGEQVTVTPAAFPKPQHADLSATTAWMQQRRMIFDATKLSDVVQEFNLYNHRQLVIDSSELSDFRVSGVYSSTDPASLLRFLREQPGIRVIETDAEVRIARQ
jgi:transmembrane sensor